MKKLFTLSLLFCLTAVFAQTKLKKAEKLFQTYAYVDAAKMYEEYLATADKPSTDAIKHAGDSYYKIDDNRNALKWYQKLYDIQGETMSEEYFLRYIQTLKGVTDYAKADKLTKEYLDKKGDQNEIARFMNQKK